MTDKISELIKNPHEVGERSTKVDFVEETNLGVGGGEGDKFNIKFELKRNQSKRDISLISKRIRHHRGSEAPSLVNSYKVVKQDGFLSPDTVRYAKVDGKDILLMTDMSEGGKYIVWGFNDKQTEKEFQAFRDLKLNDTDIDEIKKQGKSFVELANKRDRKLQFYYFHIRKERKTGEVQLFLLDVDPAYLNPPWNADHNQKEFDIFFDLLKVEPEKHNDAIRY